ncbi:MAG: hypothetical protein Q9217_003464 [Psora testacea]
MCNCPTCISSTSTIARRKATAYTRRRLGRPDVFTVFSSTLALSAAIADSTRKEARNRQWDRAISETRSEMEAAEIDQERRIASLVEAQDHFDLEKKVSSETPIRLIVFPRRQEWMDVLSWAARQDVQRAAAGFQEWRGVPLELLQNLSESDLQQLLSDKRLLHRFYGGPDCSSLVADPPSWTMSTKKLRTLEWSGLKLVLRLLLHSSQESSEGGPQPTAKTVFRLLSRERVHWQEKAQEANKRLALLFSNDKHSNIYCNFPSPEAPQYDYSPGAHDDELVESNIALQAILGELTACCLDKISKICAHLLLLHVAPNIHTYNLLLVRFCRLQEDALVHAVLDSMRESHVRPNEITHATILRFFTVCEDKQGFRSYLCQMNGLQQGLALAHPERGIHPIAGSRYHRFGLQNHKLAEKARMNSEVYSSAIVGLLKMFRREEAMWYYRNMISEGWKPTVEILTALIQDCYDIADFASGLKIWVYLRRMRRKGINIGRSAYESMLRLCDRCGRDRLYDMILKEGVQESILPQRTSDVMDQTTKNHCNDASLDSDATTRVISTRLQRKYRNIPTRVINEVLRQLHPEDELDERLWALDQSCRRQRKLRTVTRNLETAFENLAKSFADLTQEVNQSLQLEDAKILRYAVVTKATNLDRQMHPKVVQRAYDGFRKITEQQAMRGSGGAELYARSNDQADTLQPPWLGTQQQILTASAA